MPEDRENEKQSEEEKQPQRIMAGSPDKVATQELEQFKAALEHFRKRIELDNELFESLDALLSEIGEHFRQLVAVADGALEYRGSKNVIEMSANNKTLTLVPAAGTALDLRLKRSRNQYCCQVLVFGHLSGQEESRLLVAYRLYADGTFSDGSHSFNYRNDWPVLAAHLTRLLADNLLECQDIWPDVEDFPQHMKLLPVSEDKANVAALQKPCIGFECALPR